MINSSQILRQENHNGRKREWFPRPFSVKGLLYEEREFSLRGL
jgi:hypothetical protein